MEEKLLAALLAANAELIEALQQYDDLERVGMERKAEDRSRKEVRMDRRVSANIRLKKICLLKSMTAVAIIPAGAGWWIAVGIFTERPQFFVEFLTIPHSPASHTRPPIPTSPSSAFRI